MNLTDEPVCDCHGIAMSWHRDSRRTSGGYWHCRVKQCEYMRQYMHDYRKDFPGWIAEIKGDTCSECKGVFPSHCLDFHHLDPSTKLFEISGSRSRNRDSVMAEIAKCIVVCRSCHNAIEPRRQGVAA